MKKKIFVNFAIVLILMGVFCNGYVMGISLSKYDKFISYAEADNWTSCDTSDLVTAFRYYCKSRNLALNGSIADSLTSFTTATFNNICSTLGIDPTSLQAELKKTTQGNLGLRFLFSQTGITAYNRIFAEFLQNNNLVVGDDVDNEVVYSGKFFTDLDGNKCNVYIVDSDVSRSSDQHNPISLGTPYRYSYSQLTNRAGTDIVFHINNSLTITDHVYALNDVSINPYVSFDNYNDINNEFVSLINATGLGVNGFPNGLIRVGNRAIIFNQSTNKLYFGHFLTLLNRTNIDGSVSGYYWKCLNEITDSSIPTDITVDTPNNTVINNNTYNNNYVIIYNDGDTYISDDDDEPLPTTPPDGGGGGGGGGDNPVNPPPVEPTPDPDPTIPDWNIDLPEMPVGNDWLLYGLEKKFPWDIPFNLMYMLSIFAADPETPHFEGTLDFKVFQWDYDIDLSPFDEIAGYVREFEFIAFLIGLMLLTRRLIWG